jgi:dTDP-4-amino-4,6-dideoxygalactose transaminase
MGSHETAFVAEAFATNWIAPLGPHVDKFETEFCEYLSASSSTGAGTGQPRVSERRGASSQLHAAALSSGTAALHLALKSIGLDSGEEVLCSALTFSASANPIVYEGGKPVFIDSERQSWNMDPLLLEEALETRRKAGKPPRAVIVVHLYGQCAEIDAISRICEKFGVALIEDAAEALGARYYGHAADSGLKKEISPGTVGRLGIFSFNGNKIITTSGGGMLVSEDEGLVKKARFWATQARDPAPHYQHSEIGYNYRMSNVLAGIGRGQLRVLSDRVNARRANCEFYQHAIADLPGIEFMPEAPWNRCTRWLTCILVDPSEFGTDREAIRLALEAENIEARPVWKPMHLQPVFKECQVFGGAVAEDLFKRGLCLPSGSNLTKSDLCRVADVLRRCHKR